MDPRSQKLVIFTAGITILLALSSNLFVMTPKGRRMPRRRAIPARVAR
jgi:hypothetical protein